jgi:flagellar biosynthesis component FlhA
MFQKVIELAPEAFDGYWCMSMFHEQLEKEFPQLAVLSYQGLKADLNIQSVGRIEWD